MEKKKKEKLRKVEIIYKSECQLAENIVQSKVVVYVVLINRRNHFKMPAIFPTKRLLYQKCSDIVLSSMKNGPAISVLLALTSLKDGLEQTE